MPNRPWFRNHYHCDDCEVSWSDEWCHTCNDKCPECNREIQPYESEDIDIGGPEIETEEASDA